MEICQLFFFRNSNIDLMLWSFAIALVLVFWSWPVLNAHNFCKVEGFRQHDDATNVFLPHHAPEVEHCFLGGPLSHDISIGLEKALNGIKDRSEEHSNEQIENYDNDALEKLWEMSLEIDFFSNNFHFPKFLAGIISINFGLESLTSTYDALM